MTTAATRFRQAYAEHREAEGRRADPETLAALPYLEHGPFAREWAVRARTYEAFLRHVIAPLARSPSPVWERGTGGEVRAARSLKVLDAGAGTGWLCYRLNAAGHRATALDWRWDRIDGLGAAAAYGTLLERMFGRVAASFDSLPLPDQSFDIVVFDAAIHYAEDLARVLAEAKRVTGAGGQIAILDSPFYRRREDGERMVADKRRTLASALMELNSIEYLTRERLAGASTGLGLAWRRHRVRYPLWYELRPFVAAITGRRRPSRFDLWTAARS